MYTREDGSQINYLRISVTDRCNLRCMYCMPSRGVASKSCDEILRFEEILRIVRILTSFGIKRVRLTGGDPLVRKDVPRLVHLLASTEGIEEVSLTTNGILLANAAGKLKEAGLGRINISLDTLKEDKFNNITRRSFLSSVLGGIEEAKRVGLVPIKLNMVVMRGVNDDEIEDFVAFASSHGLILRFIEFMKATPVWRKKYFVPIEEIQTLVRERFGLIESGTLDYGPASYYKTGMGSIVGFIRTSENNCKNCTRLRLTSVGELKLCLYEQKGLIVRDLLRNGISDSEIKSIIGNRMQIKRKVDYKCWGNTKVYMSSVGG